MVRGFTSVRALLYTPPKSGIINDVGHFDELRLHADGQRLVRRLLVVMWLSHVTDTTCSATADAASVDVWPLLGATTTSVTMPAGAGKGGARTAEPSRREGGTKRARKEAPTKEVALPTSLMTDGGCALLEPIGAATVDAAAPLPSRMDITPATASVATSTVSAVAAAVVATTKAPAERELSSARTTTSAVMLGGEAHVSSAEVRCAPPSTAHHAPLTTHHPAPTLATRTHHSSRHHAQHDV